MIPPPPTSTLFPYTTLFRSLRHRPETSVSWQARRLERPERRSTTRHAGCPQRPHGRQGSPGCVRPSDGLLDQVEGGTLQVKGVASVTVRDPTGYACRGP